MVNKKKCGHRSRGRSLAGFDPKEIEYGISVEMEHTCDRVQAQRVAMDHLTESPLYYKELRKMERKLDKLNERRKPKRR